MLFEFQAIQCCVQQSGKIKQTPETSKLFF